MTKETSKVLMDIESIQDQKHNNSIARGKDTMERAKATPLPKLKENLTKLQKV